MAAVDHALLTTDELLEELHGGTSGPPRPLERIVNATTETIERELNRRLIYRDGPYIEQMTTSGGRKAIYTLEAPITTLTEVNEDSDRTFGAGTVLTAGTDFIADLENGRILRVSGCCATDWEEGECAVQLKYQGGYADIDALPWDIRDVALRHAALTWQEISQHHQGVSSISDATGSTTRFRAAQLTPEMKKQLERHVRRIRYQRTRRVT
jgi:hypothetical protein